MNEVQYNKAIQENPEIFTDGTIIQLPLGSVEIVEEEDQLREGGIVNSHLDELKEQIRNMGQVVPITVEEIPNPVPGGPTHRAVDGCHRHGSLKELSEEFPKAPAYKTIKCVVESFSSDMERKLYQSRCNQHLAAKSNSKNDIVRLVSQIIGNEDDSVIPEGLHKDNYGEDPECYMDSLYGWIQKEFNVKVGKAKKIGQEAASGFQNHKVKSWRKPALVKNFKSKNSIGWEGKGTGDESNGYVVYPLGETSHVNPNISGNTLKKKTVNGKNTKTAIVVFVSNTLGKKGCHIDDERYKAVNEINKVNSSWVLKRTVKLVDKVFLAPQKIGHIKEDPETYYEVPMVNGKFVTKLPKKGW